MGQIKAAIFDIDGTLVPFGAHAPGERTLCALRRLRQNGVHIIVATGRARFAALAALEGVQADYIAAVNGNWVTDAAGKSMVENRMTAEEMYALVDFCEDYELPLDFIFEDGYYAYVEYARFKQRYGTFKNNLQFFYDGENQTRHLQGLPYGASAMLTPGQAQGFAQRYGHLGLRFVPFAPGYYDVLRAGSNKAVALTALLGKLGVRWEEAAAFGDGHNDAELLQAAGFAVAMENGAESLKEIAHVVAPPAEQDGVGQIIEKYFL